MDALMKIEFGLLVGIFLLGIVFYISLVNSGTISGFFVFENKNINYPYDFVNEEDIQAHDNSVVIHVDNPIITRYANSDSMEPLLGKTANGIEIRPKSESEINVGDVITFEKDGLLIVHRVIEIGEDGQGIYFITKGDNNNVKDEKVRFSQVKSVLVAVIY